MKFLGIILILGSFLLMSCKKEQKPKGIAEKVVEDVRDFVEKHKDKDENYDAGLDPYQP